MTNVTRAAVLCAAGAGLLAAPMAGYLHAQQTLPPVSVEARGGYTFPMGDFDDRGAQSDFGYGLGLTLGVSPSFGVYGGWGRDVFHCSRCTGGDKLQASGFELGGKFILSDGARARPWARAGILASKSLIEAGTSKFESDRQLGFQGAVGVDVPVGEMASFAPSLRFNNFRSEWDGLEGTLVGFRPRTDFRYLSFDLGLRIHLR